MWKEYKEVDGMVSNYIYDLREDDQGLLWLATEEGLIRFDGYHATRIPQLTDSLGRYLPIYYINIMPDNRLWLGTKRGIRIYDPLHQTLIQHPIKFDHHVGDIIYLGAGRVIVASLPSIYIISVDENFNPVDYRELDLSAFGTSSRAVPMEFSLHENDLLISISGYGVIRGNINHLGEWDKFHLINNPFKSEKHKFLQCQNIIPLSSHQLMLNYTFEGLFIYDVERDRLDKLHDINGLEHPLPGWITTASFYSGYIYYSMSGNGLYRMPFGEMKGTPESISFESIPDFNFPDDIISSIYVKNNTLWIATIGDGLKSTSLKPDGLETLALNEYIGEQTSLFTMKTDYTDALLVGTNGEGLLYIEPAGAGKFKFEKHHASSSRLNLPTDTINEVHFSRNADLWIATTRGLCYYSIDQYKKFKSGEEIIPVVYTQSNGLKSSTVNDIFEDAGGNIYVTTNAGINMINAKTIDIVNNEKATANSIFASSNPVYFGEFLSDSSMVLFSPWMNGIVRDGQFDSHENLFPDSYDVSVYYVAIEETGITWLATNRGLYKYDARLKKTVDFKGKSFFKNKKINSIMQDDEGILWMGTNQGIFYYDPETGFINQYNIPGTSGWPFFHYGSVCKDSHGNVYFGTNKGVVTINTKMLAQNKEECRGGCQIIVSDILVNDESKRQNIVNITNFGTIRIEEDDVMEILLGFPAHHMHDNIRFEYSLNKDKWFSIDPISPHILLYQLNPGRYDLAVRVTRNGGEIITSSILPLEIDGPWWKTWWSFAIYSVMAGLVVAVYYRYRLAGVKLKQQLEMEKVTRINQSLKLDFVSNISHEFRTPLTLMLNDIDSLKSNGSSSNSSHLDKLEMNAQRLKRLANELIDIKKLEKGGVKMMVAQHDIISFVKDTTQVFEELAKKNQVELKFEANKRLELVWFNKDQLEKVLFNLLSNAFKFTSAKGTITVNIDCYYQQNAQEAIAITVRDTGKGIAENDIDKVFDVGFSQPPSHHANGFESTGIGLNLSKKLIDLHHGEITAESKQDVGSIFTIILLKGAAHFNHDQLLKFQFQDHLKRSILRFNMERKENKDAKILIIEDNKDIRYYMLEVLSHYYSVIEAKSGIDGIELAKSHLPDLIITDLSMPGKSGHAVIREIREEEMTSHIPIIVLSAFSSDSKKVEVFDRRC